MKARYLAPLLVFCCVPLAAQSPAPAATGQTRASQLGFTYSLPANWEVVDAAPMLPAARQQVEQGASSEDEKKGAACSELPLTARHGTPPSVIVVVAMPFDCFGQSMSQQDLAGFGLGAAQGITQNFNVTDTAYGAYTLGSHNFWIERAKGSPKSNPSVQATIEIACSILKKAAVCWMAMAVDADGLRAFEDGAVTLEGEPATALVPADAFTKKPS